MRQSLMQFSRVQRMSCKDSIMRFQWCDWFRVFANLIYSLCQQLTEQLHSSRDSAASLQRQLEAKASVTEQLHRQLQESQSVQSELHKQFQHRELDFHAEISQLKQQLAARLAQIDECHEMISSLDTELHLVKSRHSQDAQLMASMRQEMDRMLVVSAPSIGPSVPAAASQDMLNMQNELSKLREVRTDHERLQQRCNELEQLVQELHHRRQQQQQTSSMQLTQESNVIKPELEALQQFCSEFVINFSSVVWV